MGSKISFTQVEGYRGILGQVFRLSESGTGRNSKLQGPKDLQVHRFAAAPLVSWGCVSQHDFLCSLHVALKTSATCRPAPGIQCHTGSWVTLPRPGWHSHQHPKGWGAHSWPQDREGTVHRGCHPSSQASHHSSCDPRVHFSCQATSCIDMLFLLIYSGFIFFSLTRLLQ